MNIFQKILRVIKACFTGEAGTLGYLVITNVVGVALLTIAFYSFT